MKYFIIKDSLDEEVIGKDYPQAYKFVKGYNPRAPKALLSLYDYYADFPDYTPELDGIMLAGSAKLTDFVSTSFSGDLFTVSEKVKNLLTRYQLCPHRFYPLGLYKRKVKYNYFLFSIISDGFKYVDYGKSTFVEYNMVSRKKSDSVQIDSFEDLLHKRVRMEDERGVQWTIWGNKIVMSNNFNRELDFFSIGRIDGSNYVSERLKNNIDACGLTGWNFIPAHNLIV